MNKVSILRNPYGLTLPFALILTFIFSALVGVSYLFVSVNLYQMQSSLNGLQAISAAEGTNEKIKARLNTKSKIQLSPEQEKKLKSPEEEDEGDPEEELASEEEFNEHEEDFDEYYADEVVKISRYITFREPKKEENQALQSRPTDPNSTQGSQTPEKNPPPLNPLASVEMIGSIPVPPGTILAKGTMIVVYKDKAIDLKLKDITDNGSQFRPKLPIPVIKSLSPNYCEQNARTSFVVAGDNLGYDQKVKFNNKDITVEDIVSGPTVKILCGTETMSGITYFYWNNIRTEFYIIPPYDGSPRPEISEVKTNDGNQLISAKAGEKHINIVVNGRNLFLKKIVPVIIPDAVGIIPKVKSQSENGTQIVATIDLDYKVEPGIHSLSIATEGGLSNSWIFNVLPPDKQEDLSGNIAKVSSSLTLLEVRVLENLLPVIGEEENNPQNSSANSNNSNPNSTIDPEVSEKAKLSPFANVDIETVWLLETTAKVGKSVKTVSEVINRELPNIHAGLITNSPVGFEGGGYQIIGITGAMTVLTEPTYISNTVLMVLGPPEPPDEPLDPVDPSNQTQPQTPPLPQSPIELGFTPGSFAAVFKEGNRGSDLDYATINKVERDTIELIPPGLMDFHYENDQVYQFIPPIISGEKISDEDAEKHVIPKELAISIPGYANEQTIFRSNIEQFAELADLYTNDSSIPKDEFDIPVGYMGLTYIDGTPIYDKDNTLAGKGILIIDTRSDNQGRPIGQVEISGDSKSQSNFSGIIYIKGNLRIEGNVNINGAIIVDNEKRGRIQIADSALGKITYSEAPIKQSLLSTPFSTKAGSIMISNKPINLEGYVQSGTQSSSGSEMFQTSSSGTTGTSSGNTAAQQSQTQVSPPPQKQPEEAIIEQAQPKSGKSAEQELIDLF